MKSYDLIIIGAGPGGYVAAIRAAQLGMKVALVEKRETLGGTCLNIGCIPSKALLESSHHFEFLKKSAKEHGIEIENVSLNLAQMMHRKDTVVSGLVKGVAGLIQKHKVDWIQGNASFVNANTLMVNGESYQAKYIVIATGSDPIPMSFLPFDEKRILSSTGALSPQKIPKKMVVIGAGVIGVELASVYQRLGTEVLLIEMLDHICLDIDRTIGKLFLKILQKQGLQFLLSTKVTQAKIQPNTIEISVESADKKETISTETVLVCIGRRPYTDGLQLEKANIATDKKGRIVVDGNFQTNIANVYAIGDVIEGPQLAHKASEEGIALMEYLSGKTSHINYLAIPSVIYTNPELASVGLTEQEAPNSKIGNFPLQANPRARSVGETEGVVKVIADQNTHRLLGMHIVAPHASEMIGTGILAIEKQMTLEQIASFTFSHPTFSEAIKEAALNALGRTIHL